MILCRVVPAVLWLHFFIRFHMHSSMASRKTTSPAPMRMRAAPSNNGRHSMPPTPLGESTPKVTFISQVSLCLLGLVFMALAFGILIAPAEVQEAHGLDFYHAKPSALAEIRAYYFGTMGVLSVLLIAGACGDKPARMRGLLIAFGP